MSGLKDREKAFENKYKHDEELRFRVQVRAAKLFGLWVAAQLGLEGTEADAYAKQVVEADFEEPGINDIIRKVVKDISGKSIDLSEHRLRVEFDRCLSEARDQLMSEG